MGPAGQDLNTVRTGDDESPEDLLDALARLGVIPVVELVDARLAVPLAQALLAAGLPCAEITFRSAAAADAIAEIVKRCPDMLVGAGTVLSEEQAEAAITAGAAFVVSPGFNPGVVRHVRALGVPMLPGVCTPTEIEAARSEGMNIVKLFPAEASGGIAYLRAIAAPYRDMRFVPTGGIGPANLAGYLALPQVLACGGSWLVSRDLIEAGDFASISRLGSEAVAIVRAARVARGKGA